MDQKHGKLRTEWRIQIWYGVLLLVFAVVTVRLFQLQIIKHDYYQKVALNIQLKETEIQAERGLIEVHNGDETIPIVLNEVKYTLFADPVYVNNADEAAIELAKITSGEASEYAEAMKREDTRYVVLAKKLGKEQRALITELDFKGIGLRERTYRTYPQGTLAAQLLGFVNDEGVGAYGIEEALNNSLQGTPGRLRAITDVQGVPLAANKENLTIEPKPGNKVVLTIDLGLQRRLEDLLKVGLDRAKSESGSALILDIKTGAIKAIANYPTYDPAKFFEIEDANLFTNNAVSSPLEIGSIMKPFTLAAAIDQNVVAKDSTYLDPGLYRIDGSVVTNIEGYNGVGTRSVLDILRLSLNTGATWILMQMGGGEINEKARVAWHDYMVNRFQFGSLTQIEQGYEAQGVVPNPTEGFGLNIKYANTAFGQGMTATPVQVAAALAGILNDGKYIAPHLVDYSVASDGVRATKDVKIVESIVKASTGRDIKELMQSVFDTNHSFYGMPKLRSGYIVGGKTGTAQIANPEGGYYEDKYNGTFMGFVGGDKPEYVVVTRVNEPKIGGFAGSGAAAPVFSDLVNMLIDTFGVSPKN